MDGMADSVETAVVGGGPAGAAAAITLANSGHEVIVVDKATFPRDKCCGDGLTALALRHLDDLGVDAESVPSWQQVTTTKVRSPSGRVVTIPVGERQAAVARRGEFDAELLSTARAAGAEVRQATECCGVSQYRTDVGLDLGNGTEVRARNVVAADGMWSPVRRMLGLTPPRYLGEWHAFRQYVTDAAPSARDLWVWFEGDLLPGYAWSFPLGDGAVNVGFGVARRAGLGGKALARIWDGLLDRPAIADVLGPAATRMEPERSWPIPARLPEAALTSGRVLFVGDAAGACDPMTGEGIGQALETGVLAARAIIDGEPARYGHDAKRALAADHRTAAVLSKLLASPIRARGALRAVDLNDWTRRNFGRWMFEDYPRAVLFTPRRWRSSVRPRSSRHDRAQC